MKRYIPDGVYFENNLFLMLEFLLEQSTIIRFQRINESDIAIFLSMRLNRERKRIAVQISKNFVSSCKISRSKIFVTQWSFIRSFKIYIKNGQFLYKIFENQIENQKNYAFQLNQIFDISRSNTGSFQFYKNFKGPSFSDE